MAERLQNGDYVPDGNGAFLRDTGAEAVLGRVLFKLSVRRGSFPFLPELGSRLYALAREKSTDRAALGAGYAAEALADETEVSVTGAEWEEETHTLTVLLLWLGESLSVAVPV